MSQRNRFFILLGVIALMAAVWFFVSTDRTSDLVLQGTVDSNQVMVSARIAGRIDKLAVDEGSVVHQGDLIAQLDAGELQAQEQAMRASIRTQGARIAEAEASEELAKGSTSSDVVNAQAVVQATRAQLNEAEADLERVRSDATRTISLAEQGIASRQQADEASASLKAAQAKAQSLRDQVRAAEAALGSARARTHQAHAAQSNTAAMRAQLTNAQAQLDEAQARLGYTRITAPVSGTVSVRAARQGEVVQPGEPIVTIIDLSDTWVRAGIPETYADNIRLGDALTVRLPSGRRLPGKVIFKAAEGDFATQRDVSRSKRDIKTVALKVAVENREATLVPGMTAEVLVPRSKLKGSGEERAAQEPKK